VSHRQSDRRGRPWAGEGPIRLLIAGGGTGGHVLPAIAVLEELTARGITVDALWLGSPDGVEGDAARGAGVRFQAIQSGKLRRYLSARNVVDAFRIPVGVGQAAIAVRRFRPDVILSTGGFVSVPTVAGTLGAAPVVTHEQTAILGLATRLNMRFRPTLAVSYPETAALAQGYRGRVEVTGNPIRRSLNDGDAARGRATFGLSADLPVLTVMGGARGASPINTRIEALLPGLLEAAQVVHQTGPVGANGDLPRLEALRDTFPEPLRSRYVLREFIRTELADLYAMTDLILARAGAGTVAELAGLGLPSILIPLPHAGGNEQVRNAEVLARAGATEIVAEADATPDRLRSIIGDLLRDDDRRRRMAGAAGGTAGPGAAARLADLLIEIASTP
jgi:UDP-N-acetylglucosamine--N-acetylmuramyl-(pentapeptide) pyrophosphoryl-undecaprenol N-acetylglucosamine transferase